MKPKVLVTDGNFPEKALNLLKTKCEVQLAPTATLSRQELLKLVVEKNALVVIPIDKINAEVLDSAGVGLKCISTYSVGFDHLDLTECKQRGITACHTPKVLTNTVAELGVALTLSAARRVVEGTNSIRDGEWVSNYTSSWMFGTDIKDSVIGIFGFGRIGQAVAKRFQGFEPEKIIYHDVVDIPEEFTAGVHKVNFNQLLTKSDYIIVCATLTPTTYKIFNDEAFSKMKANAIFVNISRGNLVDQTALANALKNKKIQSAALDVMAEEPIKCDDPLLSLKNCTLTPHIGTGTIACRTKMAILAAENILNYFANQPIEGIIKI